MPCKAEGCTRVAETKVGYCVMHYKRWKRNGFPITKLNSYTKDDVCKYCGAKGKRLIDYYCKPCYIQVLRTGSPQRIMNSKGSGTLTVAGYHLITENGKRDYKHRILTGAEKGQVVHHDDENKLNNELPNLIVCESQSEHMKLHKRSHALDTNKTED